MTTPTKQEYREIPLTRGQVAVVDAADYERLTRHKWTAHWEKKTQSFYAKRTAGKPRKTIWMHREVMGAVPADGKQIDHKDHDSLNNRRSNLKTCDNAQNHWNQKILANNKTGVSGVYFDGKRYVVNISVRGRRIHLGRCDNLEQARILRERGIARYRS